MIHKFTLLPSSDNELNKSFISPDEAYKLNDNDKYNILVNNFIQDIFSKKIPKYVGIGSHSNKLIQMLSDEYLISYSDVERILVLDNCYNITVGNISFNDIYNTWNKLAITEYEKRFNKKPIVWKQK